jgi:hypothetical protein
VIKELNVNKLTLPALIFIVIRTVSNKITPSITEYSAINDSTALLPLILIVQKILIIVAIKIAYKKFARFLANTGSII